MKESILIQTIADIGLTVVFLAVLFEAIDIYRQRKKDKQKRR